MDDDIVRPDQGQILVPIDRQSELEVEWLLDCPDPVVVPGDAWGLSSSTLCLGIDGTSARESFAEVCTACRQLCSRHTSYRRIAEARSKASARKCGVVADPANTGAALHAAKSLLSSHRSGSNGSSVVHCPPSGGFGRLLQTVVVLLLSLHPLP